ncbi:MAG TPA: succinylglutamate desuccinylase/aspartoacylase family protein [Pirellulales bacterium]|nr:succinylglutamate desuccinylase/aspartoacylase family protein [Pirellulales bacterium]
MTHEPTTFAIRSLAGEQDGPHLLVTAGVHGDECEPMEAVRRLYHRLAPEPLRGRITLAPIVNEPAFRLRQRTAEDGLDLARTCPGRDDGSTTERIAAALSRLIRSADYYIDLHTGGALFDISPLAGYVLHADAAVLDRQRQMAEAFNLPIVWGTSGRLEGRSLSVARDAGVPAIYAEYGGGGGWNDGAIAAYAAGCLNVARWLNIVDHPNDASHVQYFVEDNRDQSGHLQIQHPAPAEGVFEPKVSLGQVVRYGQPLGVVTDIWGERVLEVPAAEDGLVLFLRVPPPVAAGDSLGGILPISQPGRAAL